MDELNIRTQDRSKINIHEPDEVQYWTRHLNISTEQLQKAIDKVGNAAAAVRKELARRADASTTPSGECGGK